MASKTSAIRTSLYRLILLALSAACTTSALAQYTMHNPIKGDTNGIINVEPEFSLGIQVGTASVTGLSAQYMGFKGGALSFGMGMAFGAFTAQSDYLVFFNTSFQRRDLSKRLKFNQDRGQMLLYTGGGLVIGDGLALHAPLGVQYTMVADPISYFAEIGATLGPILGNQKERLHLAAALGIRVLL